ncbi:hypothetical protein [Mesorhizobium sp. B2-1-3]|uniref:hypothetical protein n=1 Tax=Mesorhizobium sp. B2-1-3 TaxID=2589972 RepID=UPI0015E47539|nr:hypothetical protein [Mesorhizobium sp. B2-1-3]
MKPGTISTTDGIFVLDSSGFYQPYTEPEQKSSGLWMYGVLVIAVGLFGWAAYRAVLAWMAV